MIVESFCLRPLAPTRTGTLLNTATVLLGGTTGLLLKSKPPERAQQVLMRLLGVVTLCLGAKMVLDTRDIPVLVSALDATRMAA